MTHRVGERALAHGERRLGIEGFYRRAVVALPIGARLGETCGGRGPELREDTPCGGRIVLAPEQMRVRERLEPVRESEARIDLLRLLERLGGFVIGEAVEQRHATQEGRLSRR